MRCLRNTLICLIITWMALASAKDQHVSLKHKAEVSLMNFMSRSSNFLQANPSRSWTCIDYYIPLITELLEQYEENLRQCSVNAENGREAANQDASDSIDKFNDNAGNACEAVLQCREAESVKSIFECYVDQVSL